MPKSKNAKRRGRMPSLRSIREMLGWNQVTAARKLGISQPAVSMIEAKKMKPGAELKDKIATHFKRARAVA